MVHLPPIPLSQTPLTPGLWIVPTPLGNLKDITLRALETLAQCDILLAEDTRQTQALLKHYGIDKAPKRYDDHAGSAQRQHILDQLPSQAVALVSDAGTPLINDPGFKLARDAQSAGHGVHALPGPCAPILALTLSGLPTDRFTFAGYLPNKASARQCFCADLADIDHTVIVFESVHRIAEGLHDLSAALGTRQAALCREMTKKFEEVDRGDLPTLAMRWAEKKARGEFVIVIGPALDTAEHPVDIDAQITAALGAGERIKDISEALAGTGGLSKRDVYQRALSLRSTL